MEHKSKVAQKKPLLKWSLISLAIIAFGAGLYFGVDRYRENKAASKDKPEQYKVEIADIEVSVQATGQIQPDNRLVVKPSISGRIDKVHVMEGQTIRAGQILASMSSNDRAALLDMAKAKGENEVAHWSEIYKPSPIVAPLSGVVIARNIEPGQVVSTSDTAFVVSDRLGVIAQVDETDLARVKIGQTVQITLDAYRDLPFSGRVSRIAYEARQSNNVTVYDIRIDPIEIPEYLRSGMTTSVRFIEDKKTGVLTLPIAALRNQLTPKELKSRSVETTLLVKSGEKDGAAETIKKPVILGVNDGRRIEVISGLEQDAIVIENLEDKKKPSSNPFSPFGGGRPRVSGGGPGGGGSGGRPPR